MKDRYDELKSLRMQQEDEFIDLNLVDEMASLVTKDLVDWSNRILFDPLNGKLSFNAPAFGPPNAKVTTFLAAPYKPNIEISLSLFKEVYKDSFAFPLISKQLCDATDSIQIFNRAFPGSNDASFKFESGMPVIHPNLISITLKPYCLEFLKVHGEKQHPRITPNDIACRFIMFELAIVSIFFHELGHVVQRHNFLSAKSDASEQSILEIGEHEEETPDLPAQAREILADLEGLDLTLKYMTRKKFYAPSTLYVLMCTQNCMFQRFYQKYEDNLELSNGRHPHPVIRSEYANKFIMQWALKKYVDNNSHNKGEDAAYPLAYFSTRALLMSGLFWANRIERFSGDSLTSYMSLLSPAHEQKRYKYIELLNKHIREQLPHINAMHMIPNNNLRLIEEKLLDTSHERNH